MWIIAWPAYRRRLPGERLHHVVGHGEDHELHVVDERVGLREGPHAADPLAEPLAAGRVARRHRADRPPRAMERDAQRGAHGPRADDPDDRALARAGVRMRVRVVAGVLHVTVPVGPARFPFAGGLAARARPLRQRIEVDPVLVEVAQRLLVRLGAPLGLAAEHVLGLVPRPHRAGPLNWSVRPSALYASTQRV